MSGNVQVRFILDGKKKATNLRTQDKSEKPTAAGMTSIAQLHIRLVNVFRAQALDGLDTSTDPYLSLLDSYSNEIKRSCREVSRADNKQMTKDLWRWDRATTENEQKLRFCFDLQSVRGTYIALTGL